MQALMFTHKLKQTLMEIETSGGNRIFFVEPDYELIQHSARKSAVTRAFS